MSPPPQAPDVSQQFQAQLRQVRPFGIGAVVVLLAALGASAATVAVPGWAFLLPYVLGTSVLLLVVLAIPLLGAHRCPQCRKFMGQGLGAHCPLCGARLKVVMLPPDGRQAE